MPPKLVRICRMWRTFNHKNKDHCLGASFICIDIKGDTYEGKLDKTLSEKPVQVLQENEI